MAPAKFSAKAGLSGGQAFWIGSSDGDCAPSPSHTTGRAVFRIRRLNAAAFPSPQGLNIALRREVRNRSASPLHQWDRRGCTASSPSAPGLTTVVVVPSVRVASCAAYQFLL